MLAIRELSFAYDHPVLDRVGFELQAQQLCALFGPNGTGKTTLYRCILGLLRPAPGSAIELDGVPTDTMPRAALARRIAYVPQEHSPPFPYLVKEMVLMGRTPHLGGVFGPSRADRAAAFAALEMIGIAELADRSYTSLSGGQRQLVLLARALAQDADILLLDEPTASLDFGNQLLLWRTIRRLTANGKTALICTHDPNHVLWFCDRVVVLGRDGQLQGVGAPDEIVDAALVENLYGPVASLHPVADRTVALPHADEAHRTATSTAPTPWRQTTRSLMCGRSGRPADVEGVTQS
jgi:iron complex transport system ATP-binding protein